MKLFIALAMFTAAWSVMSHLSVSFWWGVLLFVLIGMGSKLETLFWEEREEK
jgi:hypothetical protein